MFGVTTKTGKIAVNYERYDVEYDGTGLIWFLLNDRVYVLSVMQNKELGKYYYYIKKSDDTIYNNCEYLFCERTESAIYAAEKLNELINELVDAGAKSLYTEKEIEKHRRFE